MTDEQRARIHRISGDLCDLGAAYVALGRGLASFGPRWFLARPDECERLIERWRATRERADAQAAKVADEIRAANRGIPNDGPDRWTVDLDRINRERNKEK